MTSGRPKRRMRTTRSWLDPLAAHMRRIVRSRSARSDTASPIRSSMRENIDLGPAREVERRARRQEIEAGLREAGAPFARQPHVEDLFHRVQQAHVARGRSEENKSELQSLTR